MEMTYNYLGNREEDIEAWGDILLGKYADAPIKPQKKKVVVKNSNLNQERHEAKIKKWFEITRLLCSYYRKNGNKTIGNALRWAMDITGYHVSKNIVTELKRFVLKMMERFGVKFRTDDDFHCFNPHKDYVPKPSVNTDKTLPTTPPSPSILINKYKNNNIIHGKPALRKLTFAIIRGRKPMEGFGKLWNRNDQEWITLESLHWDNCKVEFNIAAIFKPIYEMVEKGLSVSAIVKVYDDFLRKWHEIAVDKGFTAPGGFKPTGLRQDLCLYAKALKKPLGVPLWMFKKAIPTCRVDCGNDRANIYESKVDYGFIF